MALFGTSSEVTVSQAKLRKSKTRKWIWIKLTLYKIQKFYLTFWCVNFVEWYSFRRVSKSPETLRNLPLSAKFRHQEIRVNRNKTFHWYNLSNKALFFCQRWRESKQGILKSSAWKVLFRGQSGALNSFVINLST